MTMGPHSDVTHRNLPHKPSPLLPSPNDGWTQHTHTAPVWHSRQTERALDDVLSASTQNGLVGCRPLDLAQIPCWPANGPSCLVNCGKVVWPAVRLARLPPYTKRHHTQRNIVFRCTSHLSSTNTWHLAIETVVTGAHHRKPTLAVACSTTPSRATASATFARSLPYVEQATL